MLHLMICDCVPTSKLLSSYCFMAVIHCSLVLTFCVSPLLITVSVPLTGCREDRAWSEREEEGGRRRGRGRREGEGGGREGVRKERERKREEKEGKVKREWERKRDREGEMENDGGYSMHYVYTIPQIS